MKVTIHQPNYLPYLGIFHKILQCDVFVIYDTTQLVMDRFDNRNYINVHGKKVLLTVPISSDSHFLPWAHAKVNNSFSWREKHWKTITMAYHKAPYFAAFKDGFEKIYATHAELLPDISIPIITHILQLLGWKGKIIRSSALPINTELRSTEAILDILQNVGATAYLAGASSKKYLNESLFTTRGLMLDYHHFTHPTYPQNGKEFISHLAAIDAIFHLGEKVKDVIHQ